MIEYFKSMMKSPLFSGITKKEAESMLDCLSPLQKTYKKNQRIFSFGEKIDVIAMVLCGSVHILEEDFWGNRNILSEVGVGGLFGEVYACKHGASLGVDVVAEKDTTVLFLEVRPMLSTCSASCPFHEKLIGNLLSVLAEKNLMMNEKLTHMTKRTTRQKLLSYLSAEARKKGSADFEIPFNRQQLADYLSVDRSAMSNALCKMRDEGVLSFEKNHFTLKIQE